MKLFEMEGFLRGKCLPGDIKTGESNAEYLVRKFSELHEQLSESQREFRSADITMQNLEAQLKQSKIDADCYKKGMEASNARLVQLAAENAGLKSFKTAVYQQMGAGCEAPEFSITEGLSNLSRFADTLHAIEREFFTKEVPDEECEGETVEECPLCWGMSVEHYVSEFRKCLAEVRAQVVDLAIEQLHKKLAGTGRSGMPAMVLENFAAKLSKGVQS